MADPRHVKLAEVIVGYSTAVRKGDLVLIQAPARAAPLVQEIYRCALAAGGHPLPRIALELDPSRQGGLRRLFGKSGGSPDRDATAIGSEQDRFGEALRVDVVEEAVEAIH